jgi:predicted phosphodiesterase
MRVNILPSKLKDSIGEKDTFKILILSDLHIPIDMELKEVITSSEILKDIDHVILLGDNVACYGNDEEYRFLNELHTEALKTVFGYKWQS